MTQLPDLVDIALNRDADRPAVEFQGRWYVWGELRSVADAAVQGLARQGVDTSAPVAFVARNHPSALAVLLALLWQGRTVKMVYAFQSGEGIARDIQRLNCGAAILFQQDMAEEVQAFLSSDGLPHLVLDEMQVREPASGSTKARVHVADDDAKPHIGILTSGTTGPPKQFPLYYATIEQFFLASPLTKAQSDDAAAAPPFLLYFPLGNVTGIYSTLPMLLRGQPLVLLERFSLAAWHDYVLRHRPSHAGLPPSAFQELLEADVPPADLSSLVTLGTGAAPLDPVVQAAFEDRYNIPILLSYGATEFAGPVAMMTLDLHRQWGREKLGSVGKALPGAELRIVDADSGDDVPAGEQGLLHVRVKRMGEHWIATSDLGVIDADGFLFLKGRADGAIIRGGFKVLPETVERGILQHPAIAEVAVVAVPDSRLGQVPAALMRVKKNVAEPSISELESDLRRHVLSTHIPVHWQFCERIPLNGSQKVDRQAVKQRFE
jgi:long-chain acyl-CoA synthetase